MARYDDAELLDLLLHCIEVTDDLPALKKMAATQAKIRADQKRLVQVMAEIHGQS